MGDINAFTSILVHVMAGSGAQMAKNKANMNRRTPVRGKENNKRDRGMNWVAKTSTVRNMSAEPKRRQNK